MDRNTAVYDVHNEFGYKETNFHLTELNSGKHLAKVTLFKELDGSYYRFLPWIRCTEYFNDFLHFTLNPNYSSTRGVYGFKKGHHNQYDPTFESFAVGFGTFEHRPVDLFDPRIPINLCKVLFDVDVKMELHPAGFLCEGIGNPYGTLYWNLAKVSPNIWSCVPLTNLFFKGLRYYEWKAPDYALEDFAENPGETTFNTLFAKCSTDYYNVQDATLLRIIRGTTLTTLRGRIQDYKNKWGEVPGMFKGVNIDVDSVHEHGINSCLYKASY